MLSKNFMKMKHTLSIQFNDNVSRYSDMSEANLLKFPVVFATVFTQEIFSNFCRNALKSPNISWVGGTLRLWLDADIFTSLIISLQILGAPCSLAGHPFRAWGVTVTVRLTPESKPSIWFWPAFQLKSMVSL